MANPNLPSLGIWFVVAAPVIGGLIYGLLIARFATEAKGHGVPEVMLAVSQQGGRIRPRVAAVKALASAVCIGSGGSVGREGPIVQIGSALGSGLGQLLRMPAPRLRLLVACGAAGGISATFNAPIAGVFFALELILRDFEAESFGVVVLSSVMADVIGRAAFGSQPFLTLPGFHLQSLWSTPSTPDSASPPPWSAPHSCACSTAWRMSPTALAWAAVASARRRGRPPRSAATRTATAVRRRLPGAGARDRGGYTTRFLILLPSGSCSDQPDDLHRRLGWVFARPCS